MGCVSGCDEETANQYNRTTERRLQRENCGYGARWEKGFEEIKPFAEALGYSISFTSEIERGVSKPPTEFLIKLREVLKIPIDFFLYGAEETQDEKRVSAHVTAGPMVREPEPTYKPLLDDVKEILESGNAELVNAFRGNIKAFLGAIKAVKEKRRYHRFSFNIPVEVKLLDEPGAPVGAVINGSQMGLLIQSSYEIPKGKEIGLELSFPKETGIQGFRAKGKVVWRDKKRIDEAEEFQYGLQFTEVLNDGHAKLESLLRD